MVTTGSRSPGRLAPAGAAALTLALAVAACGGSSSPAASVAVATPSPSVAPTPSPSPSPSPTPPSPSITAVDPAEGLKIAAPYALVALPDAAQQVLEQQMTTSLGASGAKVTFGFRQITGSKSTGAILLVLGFQPGTLNDIGYAAVVGGIGAAMKADLKKTTVSGVEVSSGPIASGGTTSGGIAFYHDGDLLIATITAGSDATEAIALAKALISAN